MQKLANEQLPPVNMPHRPSLLLPLLRWELVRMARRNQTRSTRIVLLYLILLAMGLFAVWWSSHRTPISLLESSTFTLSIRSSEEDRNGSAYFAESLTLVLFSAQLLFALLVTPLCALLAIAEEKDSQNLALLLLTELRDWEIVLGKTLASVLLVFAAIVAAIPLLAIPILYGGVPVELPIVGYLLIGGTTILTASIGASAACLSHDAREATIRTFASVGCFALALPLLFRFSPFDVLIYASGAEGTYLGKLGSPAQRLALSFAYVLLQTLVGSLLLVRASRQLRSHEPTAGAVSPTAYPEPPRGRPTPIVLAKRGRRPSPLPPLGAVDPILWRERHVARTKPFPLLDLPARGLIGILVIAAAGAFGCGAWRMLELAVSGLSLDEPQSLNQAAAERQAGGIWLVTAGTLLAAGFLLPLAIGLTYSIAGERMQGTLDSLMMASIPRRCILRSKVRAHLEAWLAFGIASIAATGCGFAAERGIEVGLAAMALSTAALWLAIVCAAWLSVQCETPGRAFRLSMPAVAGAFALPLVVWKAVEGNDPNATLNALGLVTAAIIALGTLVWWRAEIELGRASQK